MAFRALFLGAEKMNRQFLLPLAGKAFAIAVGNLLYGQNLVKVLTMDAKPGKNAQLYPNDAQIRA